MLETQIKTNTEFGFLALVVQSLGEVVALLSILIAFVASAVLCARRFKLHWQTLGHIGEFH
jgi:hypothetical protein